MPKTRVLVVEDERIVALHLKQRLVRLGYEVPAVANSGDAALRHIEAAPPDVVLMDIHIDGPIDGIETASRIPEHLHVPVIYLTAYSEEGTLERARSTRPYGYLLKPFSERELHATVQMALERRRADVLLRESEQRLEEQVALRTAELEATNRALTEQVEHRLKAEAALREAQKMEAIGQLTGGIAHDFNNLLTVVGGNLELLQRDAGNPGRLPRLVDNAMKAVQCCESLIKQLLMFARRQVLRPETLDANRLISEFQLLIASINREQVELVMKLDPDLKPCRIDTAQFERAILNLVMNAHDAIRESGRIVIETTNAELPADGAEHLAGSFVMVAIRDTGCGIPAEVLPRVFDPFFTTKATGKGSGLGLSQVYGFIQESGGHVTIDSKPGQGTEVRLYLPVSTEAVAPFAGTQPPSDTPLRGGETVLVVEDDDLVRDMAVESLEELGYRVLAAASGSEGLAVLRANPDIAILFSDIVMPGEMNGVQLAVAARNLRPGLTILLTSGYTATALAEHGLEQDVPLLVKPYRPQQLADQFRRMALAR